MVIKLVAIWHLQPNAPKEVIEMQAQTVANNLGIPLGDALTWGGQPNGGPTTQLNQDVVRAERDRRMVAAATPPPPPAAPPPVAQNGNSDNTAAWILVGVILLLFAGALFWALVDNRSGPGFAERDTVPYCDLRCAPEPICCDADEDGDVNITINIGDDDDDKVVVRGGGGSTTTTTSPSSTTTVASTTTTTTTVPPDDSTTTTTTTVPSTTTTTAQEMCPSEYNPYSYPIPADDPQCGGPVPPPEN